MPPTPTVGAFLIADQVFQQTSGKWCVIGVFNRIHAPLFPWLHHSLGLFVVLADAEGEYKAKIDFCDAKDNVLGRIEGAPFQVRNRRDPAEFGVQTNALPISAPGRYFFRLYLNDEMIKDAAIDVLQTEAPHA